MTVRIALFRAMFQNLHHRLIELATADLVVVVAINLCHYLAPKSFVFFVHLAITTIEDCPQLISVDQAVAVFVKHVESEAQVIFIDQSGAVNRR